MLSRAVVTAALAALALLAACGESGSRATRPAEVLYRVSGAEGTRFRFVSVTDVCTNARDEPITATGIQGANADHQFGDRVFQAPHFFVLENAFQPIRGAFLVPDEETTPIRVDLFLGLELRRGLEISPGDCEIVDTGSPVPQGVGREVRIELCASLIEIPQGARCGDFPDDFVGFFVSFGDRAATNITSCVARPVAEACRTPATLFIERAQDQVTAVFDPLLTENPDAILQAELYVDGVLVDINSGPRNVLVEEDL
jgi:hypothetical protein